MGSCMDATKIKLLDLLAQQNTRFVVPSYKHPYTWSTIQCSKLLKDLLKNSSGDKQISSFGTIVLLDSGLIPETNLALKQLLDGQQRLVSVSLLLIVLADFAKNNPHLHLHFSFEEILNRQMILLTDYKNSNKYKLALTAEDNASYQSLLDSLLFEDSEAVRDSENIVDNLNFFKEKIALLDNVSELWDALSELEVYVLSLVQGEDNPEFVYEAMMFEYYK